MALTLRPALAGDCPALSAVALRSKAHWGYDAAFLEACRDELTVDPAQLDVEDVTLAEDEAGITGFASVALDGPEAELTMLFVAPERIGTGTGRLLFEHVMATARGAGVRRLLIESDPFAAGFYVAMGATRIGERPSASIPDRTVPLLALALALAEQTS